MHIVQAEDEGREEEKRSVDGDSALIRRAAGKQVDENEAEQQPLDFRNGSGKTFQLVLFYGQTDVCSCQHGVAVCGFPCPGRNVVVLPPEVR